MTALIDKIFGTVTYDDRSDAYYWHPWLSQGKSDGSDDDDEGDDMPTEDE